MEKDIIEKIAAETLSEANVTKATAIDIIELARNLGFVVGNVELSNDDDGFIIVKEKEDEILGQPTNKLIGVRANQSKECKRFVIAHEIGHYKLYFDRESSGGIYAHRNQYDSNEDSDIEADYFALNLLMPKDIFMQNYEELKDKNLQEDELILLLAKRFCVNEKMIKRRLKELK